MHRHACVVYIAGPKGTRICTEHQVEFAPPGQCPRCKLAHAAPKRRASVLPPEIAAAIADEVSIFDGIAEEAGAAADNASTDSGRAALMRIKLSAATEASKLRLERVRAEVLVRLADKKPAATAAKDPRDAFGDIPDDLGTAAADAISVTGDN